MQDRIRETEYRGQEPEVGSVFFSPVFWARLFLGGVFILASVDKIAHPSAFAQIIHNYGIMPDILVNLAAVVLPWLELIVGVSLVFGFWLPGAAFICQALLTIFLGALIFNVARGLDVHCGCFSTNASGKPHTLWYLFRDTVFFSVGGYLLYKVRTLDLWEIMLTPARAFGPQRL